MDVHNGHGPTPAWFAEQYRSLIRATHTHAELDRAREFETAMLARTTTGQADVRDLATTAGQREQQGWRSTTREAQQAPRPTRTPRNVDRPLRRCNDDRVGYLPDATEPATPTDDTTEQDCA